MKYRSEVFFGEGYRDIVDVMHHEIFELENSDIPTTLINTICKNTRVEPILQKMIDAIDDEVENEIYALLECEDNDKSLEIIKDIVKVVCEQTHKDIKYCLWLCDTKDDVRRYCLNDEILLDDDIDAYEETNVILSDLGKDGKLYGYEVCP